MKILVDVNILVDAIEDRSPFNVAAQQIILYVERHLSESFVTTDSLTNLYYVITRNTKDFAHSPIPALTTEAFLAKVQNT